MVCCMGTCLEGLRKTTEITDQNSRCGSRFSAYVCRKFTFRNVMLFVAGSKCQVPFGTAMVVGRQQHWGHEQWGGRLSKGSGQGTLGVELEICFECSQRLSGAPLHLQRILNKWADLGDGRECYSGVLWATTTLSATHIPLSGWIIDVPTTDWKGCSRNQSRHNQGAIPGFVWKNCGKNTKILLMATDLSDNRKSP